MKVKDVDFTVDNMEIGAAKFNIDGSDWFEGVSVRVCDLSFAGN